MSDAKEKVCTGNDNLKIISSTAAAATGKVVHVNPNFVHKMSSGKCKTQPHINPNFFSKNPNSTGRRLPAVPDATNTKVKPHFNPVFIVNKAKTKAYEEAIMKAVEENKKKVYVNPNFRQQPSSASIASSGSSSSSEKENKLLISPATKAAKLMMGMTSGGKKSSSLFKKIGTRKLVRINNKKSPCEGRRKVPETPQSQIRNETGSSSHCICSSSMSARVYKVKTRQKIVKVSPPSRGSPAGVRRTPQKRNLFLTPLSLSNRLKRSRLRTPKSGTGGSGGRKKRTPFAAVLSQFRVDRRKSGAAAVAKKRLVLPHDERGDAVVVTAKPASSPIVPFSPPKRAVPPPPKPARKLAAAASGAAARPTTLVRIDGVRYSMSANGRRLQVLGTDPPNPASSSTSTSPNERSKLPVFAAERTSAYRSQRRKFYLEGEEYIEEERGVLVRSRHSMTRASINSAKARSINTIIKSQTRSRQYCMFFNKFGKCNKKDKGICPYIHDREKVAVCRKFLHGTCDKVDTCLLSHQVAPEKMPSCRFFLQGLCTRDHCPYRHVKVNDSAEICKEFQKGFCPLAADCKKRHEDGSKATSSLNKSKKVPPEKPKRKSVSAVVGVRFATTIKIVEAAETVAAASAQQQQTRAPRYYDEAAKAEGNEADDEDDLTAPNSNDDELRAKRQRLMRKVELAKQGWLGAGATVADEDQECREPLPGLESPNDSGPYEKIDDDDDDKEEAATKTKREPVGMLPSFISLPKSSDEDEDPNQGAEMSEDEISNFLGATTPSACDNDIVIEAEEDCEERLI